MSQNNPPQVASPLLKLLELSRQARKAETAAALQFMLVNQTFELRPFMLGAFWVEGEGVLAQSGVSHVEANAPFVQWICSVCETLAKTDTGEPRRISANDLDETMIAEWGDYLPASALWLPVYAHGVQAAGLMLARQEPWEDDEVALLVEWVDIWSHAWNKLHAPSIKGELANLKDRVQEWLPERRALKQEAHAFRQGWRYFVAFYFETPGGIRRLVRDIFTYLLGLLKKPFALLKAHGFSGVIDLARTEARAIWADKRRRLRWIVLLLILFPVRLTVLAPAELVPANPAIIRVPIEGVVGEFYVSPNQHVEAGQPLFDLDLTTLTSKLNVARQETQIAASEYRQSALQSLTDAKSRAQLVPQEGKAAERRVEASYLEEMLEKAKIKSPREGIVLFDDPSEWIGKPVAAGEKVMVVASPGDVEIEAWIPVGDAIALEAGAPVTLYLNATPLSPISGEIRYMGHEAMQRPDGTYAYRLRAALDTGEKSPHVGLKGTAKVAGSYVPLVYWVLRKPLGSLRQYLGI